MECGGFLSGVRKTLYLFPLHTAVTNWTWTWSCQMSSHNFGTWVAFYPAQSNLLPTPIDSAPCVSSFSEFLLKPEKTILNMFESKDPFPLKVLSPSSGQVFFFIFFFLFVSLFHLDILLRRETM